MYTSIITSWSFSDLAEILNPEQFWGMDFENEVHVWKQDLKGTLGKMENSTLAKTHSYSVTKYLVPVLSIFVRLSFNPLTPTCVVF